MLLTILNYAVMFVALGMAGVALRLAAKGRAGASREKRDGGCHEGKEHDWLNWSAPAPLTRKVAAGIMGQEVIEQEVFVQTRSCTRCNLHQRAVS